MSELHTLDLRLGPISLTFDPAVLATFRIWQQAASQPEACGILLGMQWPDRWVITEGTAPQPGDRRTRLGYVRESHGHLEIAQQRWIASRGLIGYVGEWHTHPSTIAMPSGKDLREAIRLSARHEVPILSVVIGNPTCAAFLAKPTHIAEIASFDLHNAVPAGARA